MLICVSDTPRRPCWGLVVHPRFRDHDFAIGKGTYDTNASEHLSDLRLEHTYKSVEKELPSLLLRKKPHRLRGTNCLDNGLVDMLAQKITALSLCSCVSGERYHQHRAKRGTLRTESNLLITPSCAILTAICTRSGSNRDHYSLWRRPASPKSRRHQ